MIQLRGFRGGLLGYFLIAALVVGGLGWATVAMLRLEREQIQSRLQAEHDDKIRLALWRLDTRIAPYLAREETRPYHHYSILYAPSLTLQNDGTPHRAGTVLHISPLVQKKVPQWMRLHFQVDAGIGWTSPQVPPGSIIKRLEDSLQRVPFLNVTADRQQLLSDLQSELPAIKLMATAQQEGGEPVFEDKDLGVLSCNNTQQLEQSTQSQMPNQATWDPQTVTRFSRRGQSANAAKGYAQEQGRETVYRNILGNGLEWLTPRLRHWKLNPPITVSLTPLVPVWLNGERDNYLLLLRLIEIENEKLCQGIVIDEAKLQTLLLQEIEDLFPDAKLSRVKSKVVHPERTMAAMPFQLEAGQVQLQGLPVGWSPLRIGLILAWVAALVALGAVGFGGWSLIDLSERRFRFVSAVTHELRTPLTTLRLYLDMLVGGMIKEEKQKEEYLETLSVETERLHRLVTNVLSFSRLEKQQPRLLKREFQAVDLLQATHDTWKGRCEESGKHLVMESTLPPEQIIETDGELAQQILDNLIDNACKYSQEADNPRIFLRCSTAGNRLVFEIEDCGPGIPAGSKRSIFRAFRRGGESDVISGGVGLGLALADRWARLLGGKLTLDCSKQGACFRLELPL